MPFRNILPIVILIIHFGCSLSGQVKDSIIKDFGFIIFYDSDLVFIPSQEIMVNDFFESYKGDTGYLINDKGYFSKLRDSSNAYHVVTNYLISDSLISEVKQVAILPVTITSHKAYSNLHHEFSVLLFRFNGRDYLFNYCSYGFRRIIDINVRRIQEKPPI